MDGDAVWTIAGKALVALSPILFAALSWLSLKLALLINAKTRSESLKSTLLRLDDAALAAVQEAEQVLVNRLRTMSADGGLTEDERGRVKEAVLESVRAQMGMRGIAEASRVLGFRNGEIDRFLSTRVEASVHRLRMNGVREH